MSKQKMLFEITSGSAVVKAGAVVTCSAKCSKKCKPKSIRFSVGLLESFQIVGIKSDLDTLVVSSNRIEMGSHMAVRDIKDPIQLLIGKKFSVDVQNISQTDKSFQCEVWG